MKRLLHIFIIATTCAAHAETLKPLAHQVVKDAAARARLTKTVYPHLLRHSWMTEMVRNGMSRYHLVQEALRWARQLPPGADRLADFCESQLVRHQAYVVQYMEDMPEVRDWTWPH